MFGGSSSGFGEDAARSRGVGFVRRYQHPRLFHLRRLQFDQEQAGLAVWYPYGREIGPCGRRAADSLRAAGIAYPHVDGESLNLRSNSIDVPVLASFRMLKPLRIYAGPVFTVMNDCKQKSGGDLLDFGRI